jgi:aminoglycoside phosphotransferase (APT) family kinase protein
MNSDIVRHIDTFRNANLMQEIFQRHLAPADNPSCVVESCAVDFVRQASTRCLVQYTIQFREREAGPLRSQVVTGVTYDEGRATRILARARRSGLRVIKTADMALFAVAYVPELNMLLQVFPYDFRLPALAQLMQKQPAEATAAVTAEMGPGDWQLESWEAESLRYRVDMRAMVRLDVRAREVESDQEAHKRVYAKIYREPEDGARAYELQRALWEQTSADGTSFVVARPIAWLAGLRTMLLDEAPGTRFLDILRGPDEALIAARRVARATAALHQLPLDESRIARERPPRDEIARLKATTERLQVDFPELDQAVIDVSREIAGGIEDGPPAPTHFDLKPAHILLDDERVAMLDFDKLVIADPMVDVAGLLTHIGKERGHSERRQMRTEAIARAFVEEYFSHVPAAWYDRLPAFYALTLLVEAARTGSSLRGRAERPDSAKRMAALIRAAHNAAAGNLWA